jgi:5-methyltetrahydrofolate--homocysteine methyltransferase
MDKVLQTIFDQIVSGDINNIQASVQAALDARLTPESILNQGMKAAMEEVGQRFERSEYFVPEMLIAANAMQQGLAILKPHMIEEGIEPVGKVVIGTVAGDLHDIGKNLVAMMLKGGGFEVTDLGTDVSPVTFLETARNVKADLIGLSALLTTTMENMRATVEYLREQGVKTKILVGGAPVTEDFAQSIDADGYATDASRSVTLAKKLVT